MLSEKFQRRIFEAHVSDHYATIKHGGFEYGIAYNSVATIHTWIIRRKETEKDFHWLQPLSEKVR